MKWMVRMGVLLSSVVLGCLSIPVVKVGSGDTVSTTIRYVALGDSIACGYGLSNPGNDSYVGQVEQYLEGQYDYVVVSNFGTNGLRSGQLLDILTNPDNPEYKRYHATLQYADVITLSIGSNDLLHLLRLDADIQKYIEDGGEMFQRACQEFQQNFPAIIAMLAEMAPEAEIYVDNVYNPCRGLKRYKGLYEQAEHYITLLNQTFVKESGYRLVDIKTAFDASQEKLINMDFQGREFDPHPNQAGHALIGSRVIEEMKK
ncbi:MAG: hypothetical protein J1F02_07435 [Lachnospiraceae bacterium]|nr:hypothetical protein [Lachnospiraceae bacterium]